MWRRSINSGLVQSKKAKKGAVLIFIVMAMLALGVAGFTAGHRDQAEATVGYANQARGAMTAQQSGNTAASQASGSSAGAGASPVDVAPPMSAAQPQAPASGPAQAQTKPWERMIIRTAALQLMVKDVSASVDSVRLLANSHGGLVLTSDSHQDGEYTVSTITIEVPSQEFDRVMPELRKLNGLVKKITSENVTSSDVSEEYTDLQSQLRNLQATEARMLALQGKADKLEDVLSLDRELRQVQGDIEKAQGRLTFLGKRSDMSSITVNLSPDAVLVEALASNTGWQPGEVAQKAWNDSLALLAGMTNGLLTVVVFFWWTIPLLLLSAWAVARARRRTSGPRESQPNPTPAANS